MQEALKEKFREKEEILGRKLTCHITTMGCQMNARDSEKLLGVLTECGAVPVETEDAEAGTHTFALRFKKRGLVFSVR